MEQLHQRAYREAIEAMLAKDFGGEPSKMIARYEDTLKKTRIIIPDDLNQAKLAEVAEKYPNAHGDRSEVAKREFAQKYFSFLEQRILYGTVTEKTRAVQMKYALAFMELFSDYSFMALRAPLTRLFGLAEVSRKLFPRGTGLEEKEMVEAMRGINNLLVNS